MNLFTIGVVGLGYVGLPLAVEFGKKFRTLGFDPSEKKIAAYRQLFDPTGEVSRESFEAATYLTCSTSPRDSGRRQLHCRCGANAGRRGPQPRPHGSQKSSETVGKHMQRGAVVVYESTVYPGATEEVCIPILERLSGLTWKKDFFVGYSPERINPGDKERTPHADNESGCRRHHETLSKLEEVYGAIITAGVFPASSIKVAEAAKVIENTQRDLNIALMNELSIIFKRMGMTRSRCWKRPEQSGTFCPSAPALSAVTVSALIPTT